MRWKRRLSANGTFAAKAGPVAFVTLWAVGTVAMLFDPSLDVVDRGSAIAALVLLASLAWFGTRQLKRVSLEDGHLVVSNYLRTIRVPFANVKAVEAHHTPYMYLSIDFVEPTRFGSRITFVPPRRFVGLLPSNEHEEIVRTLSRLALEAKEGDVEARRAAAEAAERELRLRGL